MNTIDMNMLLHPVRARLVVFRRECVIRRCSARSRPSHFGGLTLWSFVRDCPLVVVAMQLCEFCAKSIIARSVCGEVR